MNAFILRLFGTFHDRNITYCHFKSNNNLVPALNGVDDLDLLVAKKDVDAFMQVLAEYGYRLASDRNAVPTPFVYHFFGIDPETGLIVHLHVYFRMITGGSILKNHWIRVESMLLAQSAPKGEGGVFIPSAEADLILFVIRKYIEQPSLVEHYLFLKDWGNINAELKWLVARADRKVMHALVEQWLPEVPVTLVEDGLDILLRKGGVVERVRHGLRMRSCFQNTVYSDLKASLMRSAMFFIAYMRPRLRLTRKERFLFPGGMLVAFTGSEASGKSTLSLEVAKWLGERFDVSHIHLGKPNKNWRTRPLWMCIRLYSLIKRKIKKQDDVDERVVQEKADRTDFNLPNPVVCWLDSVDRKCWLRSHFFRVMRGGVVVTDRYPAREVGGLDGARIQPTGFFTGKLSKWEKANYEVLPTPDIVFRAIAPLEVTLLRNSQRENPEPQGFVRQRYELAKKINFSYCEFIDIDTTLGFDGTLLNVQSKIWGVKKVLDVRPSSGMEKGS